MANVPRQPNVEPTDNAAAETGGNVRVQFPGEKIVSGSYVLDVERDFLELRNQVIRYSELTAISIPGFAFCALLDVLRAPSYQGWIIFGILMAVIFSSIVTKWYARTRQQSTDNAQQPGAMLGLNR